MSTREQILELLDAESGLRCLSRRWKIWLAKKIVLLTDNEAKAYLRENLAFLASYFEPLVDAAGFAGDLEIAAIGPTNSVDSELGPGVAGDNPLQWLRSAESKFFDAAGGARRLCIGDLALFVANSFPNFEQRDPHEIASCVHLTVHLLRSQGCNDLTLRLLHDRLHLTAADWESTEALSEALRRGNLDVAIRFNYVLELATTIDPMPEAGHHIKAFLLQTYLALKDNDYHNHVTLREALDRQDSPLKFAPPHTQTIYLTVLANALRCTYFLQGPNGPDRAVLLLETHLGWTQRDFQNHSAMFQALRDPNGPLEKVRPDRRAFVLRVLGESLCEVPERGPDQAIIALETYIGCGRKGDYDDLANLSGALNRNAFPFKGLSVYEQALTIGSLAGSIVRLSCDPIRNDLRRGHYPPPSVDSYRTSAALRRELEFKEQMALAVEDRAIPWRGAQAAALLVEAYLRLPATSYEDQEILRTTLAHPSCPFTHLPPEIRVKLLVPLADALGALPPNPPSWWESVPRRFNPELSTQGFWFESLTRRAWRGGSKHAAWILEACLPAGFKMPQFEQALGMCVSPFTLRRFVESWLTNAPDHEDALTVCRALVEYTSRQPAVASPLLDSFDACVASRFEIWPAIATSFLAHTKKAAEAHDEAAQEGLLSELHLLSEKFFENRLSLIDLLRADFNKPDDDLARPSIPWIWKEWPILNPDTPPGPAEFRDGYLPVVLTTVDAQQTSEASRELEEHRSPSARAAGTIDTSHANSYKAIYHRLRNEPDLAGLIPNGAVWLRTMFDLEQNLHWSGWWRGDKKLKLLHRGTYSGRAYGALAQAALRFDVRAESVWAALNAPLTLSHRAVHSGKLHTLREQCEWLLSWSEKRNGESAGRTTQLLESIAKWIIQVTPKPESLRLPGSQVVNPAFCSYVMDGDENNWLRELWHGAWETIAEGCRRQLEAEAGLDGRMTPEDWRRAELNAASHEYLEAVQRVLDLSGLWAKGKEAGVCWSETDMLLQLQGPLWSAPLAWLPFGSDEAGRTRRIYHQVASTSCVPSLMVPRILNESTELRRAQVKDRAEKRILSAQWVADCDRRSKALARLHRGLQLAAKPPWRVYGLGDHPEANAENLDVALAALAPEVVVIAAHGDGNRTGVQFRNSRWPEWRTDLTSVDLLVLVACALGPTQGSYRDVEGLIVQLAAKGGRAVTAARWPIADTEAVTFVTEFVKRYLALREQGCRFASARALNQTRLFFCDNPDRGVSWHLASAFDLYGL